MKSVYEAAFEHLGYRVFFHFDDITDAMSYKELVEERRSGIFVTIRHYKVMEKLPNSFIDVIDEILKELETTDKEKDQNENLLALSSEKSD